MREYRQDFPIFKNTDVVYFDSAATTQKPQAVIDALGAPYLYCNGNVHRSPHRMGIQTTRSYEAARTCMKSFFGAGDTYEAVFTRGTTEGINLVAAAYLPQFPGQEREVIVTAAEHHSNLVPWQQYCKKAGWKLLTAPVLADGRIDLKCFQTLLSEKTVLVAIAHLTNVFGTVQPVREIARLAHRAGAAVLLDGAQAAGHFSVNLEELDCDFYAVSGHKLYGPNGIGVLYGRKSLLEQMEPWQYGGEMIDRVTWKETTYQEIPYKFEAGTPDYTGAIGLAEAVNYLKEAGGMEAIQRREEELFQILAEKLAGIKGIMFPVAPCHSVGILSFRIDGQHTFDTAALLDAQGIAVRCGTHCAQPLMQQYDFPDGTVRVSLGIYNTEQDINRLTDALKRITERKKQGESYGNP